MFKLDSESGFTSAIPPAQRRKEADVSLWHHDIASAVTGREPESAGGQPRHKGRHARRRTFCQVRMFALYRGLWNGLRSLGFLRFGLHPLRDTLRSEMKNCIGHSV